MADKEPQNDPLEKKSYSKQLFVWGSLLMLITLWAMVDEGIIRRTWKGYQREFNQIELARVQENYKSKKRSIEEVNAVKERTYAGLTVHQLPDDPGRLSLRMIRLKLERATITLESPEYKETKGAFRELQIALQDVSEKRRFAKANQDEVYYRWKHALHEGRPHKDWERKYWALEEQIKNLGKEIRSAEKRVVAAQKGVDSYEGEVAKWKKAEENYFAPLQSYQRRIDAIVDRSLDIQQVVIPDLGIHGEVQWGTVDRCMSCHIGVDRAGLEDFPPPFKTHPHRDVLLKNHPVAEFGCTVCHWGQGRAAQIVREPFEEGDFAHGYDPSWEKPLLRGDFLQSSCYQCHRDQWSLDFAPVAIKGKRIFMEIGCIGCHDVKGFEDFPQAGPDLRRIGHKVRPEWIIPWILDPRSYDPHTYMPKPPIAVAGEMDAVKIASYLFQASKDYPLLYGPYPETGDIEAGKQLFEAVDCYGCHQIDGEGNLFAPSLDHIAEKTHADWLFNWIQDPKSYIKLRVPHLHLTSQEAADITAFLMTKGKPASPDEVIGEALKNPNNREGGFLLITQYGCYGCHEIEGAENLSKLSVALSTIGSKTVGRFDFGDTNIPRTWENWIFNKIKNPRVYIHERTSSRMPQFSLKDDAIQALLVFLKGLRGEEPPPRFLPTNPEVID